MSKGRLAVIAGDGLLPVYWLENAAGQGYDTVVLGITDRKDMDELQRRAGQFYKVGAGRLGEMLGIIRSLDINSVALLGKVGRNELFAGKGLDDRLARVVSRLSSWNAAGFFSVLEAEFQSEGIELLEQTLFMEDHIACAGNMNDNVDICSSVMSDMEKGFLLAKKVSGTGIGQSLVIKDGTVAAVEALEGTNEAIARSGSLVRGGVVVKVSADNQDLRFDVPTTGIETIKCMIEARSAALVVEAGRTLMLDRSGMLELAAGNGIAVYGRVRDA